MTRKLGFSVNMEVFASLSFWEAEAGKRIGSLGHSEFRDSLGFIVPGAQ